MKKRSIEDAFPDPFSISCSAAAEIYDIPIAEFVEFCRENGYLIQRGKHYSVDSDNVADLAGALRDLQAYKLRIEHGGSIRAERLG